MHDKEVMGKISIPIIFSYSVLCRILMVEEVKCTSHVGINNEVEIVHGNSSCTWASYWFINNPFIL